MNDMCKAPLYFFLYWPSNAEYHSHNMLIDWWRRESWCGGTTARTPFVIRSTSATAEGYYCRQFEIW